MPQPIDKADVIFAPRAIDRAALLAPITDGDLRLEQMAEPHREGLRAACAADTEIWAMYPNDWLGHFDVCFDAVLRNDGRCPFTLILGVRVVGMSGYLNFALDRQALEIGNTYILPQVRGTGLNGRIKHLLLDRAFGCGIRRVEFRVDEINQRSQAAVLKLGAVKEGVLRAERITWTGRVRDTGVFSILAGRVAGSAQMTDRTGPPLHGWLILDKPHGLGSTQVVSAVKRALREGGYAKVKVGHGGTLDPLATGVLPIALGEATKLAGRMLDASKAYDFTIAFGTQTDGLDAEGAVVAVSDLRPKLEQVLAVLPRFTGPIEQVPPAYSALKIDGERAYDRARRGEDVAMVARSVVVHDLKTSPARGGGPRSGGGVAYCHDVCDKTPPLHRPEGGPPPRAGEVLESVTLTAHVSKGTYIRSLARDIALACGTVGHVAMLRRTRAGPFGLDVAISLDILAESAKRRSLEEHILPLEAGLDGIPALSLAPGRGKTRSPGRTLFGQSVNDGLYLAKDGPVPVALVMVIAGTLAVERGFNL